jgi:hypothetical protein
MAQNPSGEEFHTLFWRNLFIFFEKVMIEEEDNKNTVNTTFKCVDGVDYKHFR